MSAKHDGERASGQSMTLARSLAPNHSPICSEKNEQEEIFETCFLSRRIKNVNQHRNNNPHHHVSRLVIFISFIATHKNQYISLSVGWATGELDWPIRRNESMDRSIRTESLLHSSYSLADHPALTYCQPASRPAGHHSSMD